jgi:branched-chain amino acid transport system substrate-binding protein
MSTRRRWSLILAALLSLPVVAGGPVKLGVILPRTGPEAPIGEEMANGIRMAQEDLKKKGVVVELVWEDDTGKPQIAMSAFEKLVLDPHVAGVLGSYTSASTSAVARLAGKYQVPLMIPISSKDEITMQDLRWVFRINSPASFYASTLFDMLFTQGQVKTLALIYENTDFGNSAARSAIAYATKRGMTVVADEPYAKGAPDYRSTLSKFKAKNPDVVYMVSYIADAVLLMRQAKEIGLQPKAFLGAGGGFNLAQFAREKEISENVITSTQWAEDVKWPGAKDFAQRYRARFGMDSSHHGACSYEAFRILAETAVQAGGNRDRTRQGLKAGTWTGILGAVKFEDFDGFTNQNHHPILVQQIQGGAYQTVYPAGFAARKPVYPFPKWK